MKIEVNEMNTTFKPIKVEIILQTKEELLAFKEGIQQATDGIGMEGDDVYFDIWDGLSDQMANYK